MEVEKDNKGQREKTAPIKDVSIAHSSDWNTLSELIRRRADKLSAASYLLTEHISIAEPVRQRVREVALGLMRGAYEVTGEGHRLGRREASLGLSSDVDELISLFSISAMAGMVSERNVDLVKQELLGFKEYVVSFTTKGEKVSVSTFFEALPKEPSSLSLMSHEPPKGQSLIKDNTSQKDILIKDKIKTVVPEIRKEREGVAVTSDRRATILKLIRKDRQASIKDICGFFTDVSEKTIQRELTKMVSLGLIVRTGDKRWSRYSLA